MFTRKGRIRKRFFTKRTSISIRIPVWIISNLSVYVYNYLRDRGHWDDEMRFFYSLSLDKMTVPSRMESPKLPIKSKACWTFEIKYNTLFDSSFFYITRNNKFSILIYPNALKIIGSLTTLPSSCCILWFNNEQKQERENNSKRIKIWICKWFTSKHIIQWIYKLFWSLSLFLHVEDIVPFSVF